MKLKILFINYNVSFPLSFELKLIEFDHRKCKIAKNTTRIPWIDQLVHI